MSVKLYDDALIRKITKWIKDDKLKILSPEDSKRLFQQRADMQKDKPLDLPIVALSRDTTIDLEYPSKKPMTFDGMMLEATYDKTLQIDAIPMVITYQLDIYTRYAYECDEYVRNFVFNIINHPKVEVVLPYNNKNYVHNAYMRLIPSIEDTSDIPMHLWGDQFTRWTIRFTIDDAYFFSLPYKDNVHIVGYDLEVKED